MFPLTVHTVHKELFICQFLGKIFEFLSSWTMIFVNQLIVTKTNKKKELDSEKMCGTPLGKKALEINPGPN